MKVHTSWLALDSLMAEPNKLGKTPTEEHKKALPGLLKRLEEDYAASKALDPY